MSFFDYVQSFGTACISIVKFVAEILTTQNESDIGTSYSRGSHSSGIHGQENIYRRTPAYKSRIVRDNVKNESAYFVPDEIMEYVLNEEKNRNVKNVLNDSEFNIGNTVMQIKRGRLNITEQNYAKYNHILLWLEEVAEKKKYIGCKFYNVRITKCPYTPNVYTMDMPCVEDKKFLFHAGSTFTIMKSNAFEDTGFSKPLITRIKSITDDTIQFHLKGFSHYDLTETLFDIHFKFSRFFFVKMHLAIDNVARYLKSTIFPQEAAYNSLVTRPLLRYFNPNIESNYEQAKAVTRIVQGSSGKAPFILHGPPGTGKTVTVVEAILQLVKQNTTNRILLCAHSNTAVDNVACILIKYIKEFDKNLFLRVYSKNREGLPDILKDFSEFGPPDLKLRSYRIILCTLTHTSSYNLNFITHVVIDEAGQASEPSSLLPMYKMNIPCQLILSGDDKQLGPVVQSSEAKKFGFETSLMERLKSDCKLYCGDNDRYMVMLKKNYRSDLDIIHLPNVLFYGGKLCAMAKSDILTQKNILNQGSKCRGIVFHAVLSTESKKGGENPSYFNVNEFEIVKRYINTLRNKYYVRDEDIGIITPYSAQVTLIKDWVKRERLKIDVNTVDAFQGQERRVILISTVRGKGEKTDNVNLGFVTDVKRFNVALTRAKAKAIVIGNPLFLRTNDTWYEYIRRCKGIGTYYGVDVRDIPQDLNVMMRNLRL